MIKIIYTTLFLLCATSPLLTMNLTKNITKTARTQKRNVHSCACLKKIKYASAENCSMADDIATRTDIYDHAVELMHNKTTLQEKKIWPMPEGTALEAELFKSTHYCPDFGTCADQIRAKKFLAVFGCPALMSFAVTSPVPLVSVSATILTAYTVYLYVKSLKCNEILANIAYQDLQRLQPMYENFIVAQRVLRNVQEKKLWEQENIKKD